MEYILVLDDDPQVSKLVSSVLRSDGFCVQSGGSGANSLELMAGQQPILVVLDLQMPVMNGEEFHAAARKAGYAGPFIILSGSVHAMAIQAQLHAEGYLAKPFDPDELINTVHELLAGPALPVG